MRITEIGKMAEEAIREILLSDTQIMEEVLEHSMSSGGKRIRAGLVMLSCEAAGGRMEQALYGAAAIELLHNYSLVIDDIIDRGEIRRGKPTVIKEFGLSATECAGIDYASSVFKAGNMCGSGVVETLSRTMKILTEGEMKDVLFEQAGRDEPFYNRKKFSSVSIDDYYDMVSKKTGELTKASCEVGAVMAEAGEEVVDSLKEYGYNLGMAFQITDDILDIFGEEKVFGKKIGKDILEHKLGNILVLLANKKEVFSILRESDPDFEKAVRLIGKTDARKKAEEKAEEFIRKAKESLDSLPETGAKKELLELADYIIKRKK
jgi:geranylgeranyl diphosphate synthase type I